MRADSALSHLKNDETCIVILKNGERHEVRWSIPDWRFYFTHAERATACDFDDIREWMPATIRFHL